MEHVVPQVTGRLALPLKPNGRSTTKVRPHAVDLAKVHTETNIIQIMGGGDTPSRPRPRPRQSCQQRRSRPRPRPPVSSRATNIILAAGVAAVACIHAPAYMLLLASILQRLFQFLSLHITVVVAVPHARLACYWPPLPSSGAHCLPYLMLG